MEKYLVPATPSSQTPKSVAKRPRWKRSLVELIGKFDSEYRHDISSLSMQSYSQIGAFPHAYHIDGSACQTHVHWFAGGSNDPRPTAIQGGISALEFDSKGIYLASVTKEGCLTVHDFDELYFQVSVKNSIVKEDETKQVLHTFAHQPLDVVRWNLANQDEVACTSRKSGELLIYDIGYISLEPVEILRQRPTVGVHGCVLQKGLSDIAFSSDDKSRLLASDMHGMINIWDRRMSDLPYLYLTTNSTSAINSIKFNIDNQVIFGASKHGIIYMWDLRGGNSSAAFQNNKMAYYSPLISVKLASELDKIGSLKAQSNIVSKEILSVDLNPSCPYQLAFHLDDGWSGVFDVHNLRVTHIHCPPPAWLDDFNDLADLSYMRKPSWLPMSSIYAVGSSSKTGLHLLDFYQDRTSPCHVDYNEDSKDVMANGQHKQNTFIPLSDAVTACTAHPLHGAIIAGTKQSSLLLLSQGFVQCRQGDDSPI